MTRSVILIALAAQLSGCGCQPGALVDSDSPVPPCQTTIEETHPEAGSADFYHRADLEITVEDPDPDIPVTISLQGPDGSVAGESWLSEDEETAFFTSDEALEPTTDYAATISTCMGDSSIDFTTSELGLPLEVDITGATYLVSIFGGRILEPPGLQDLITTFGTPMVLIEVQAADDDLALMGAMAEDLGPDQDLCTPTFHFPTADFSDSPWFEVPEMDLAVDVGGMEVVVHAFVLEGTFAADGSRFGGGIVGGELDARDVVDLIDEVDSPDDMCDLTASFGAPCVPCSYDDEPYCLEILIDRLQGEQVETDLEEVTDPDSNPDCSG